MYPRNDTFPDEVLLRLSADALEWCGASRADPLSLEGLRERFLPGATFRGRQNAKLQCAVLADTCAIQVEEDRSSSLAAGGLGESSGFACAVSC
jgi:hypothetical protein